MKTFAVNEIFIKLIFILNCKNKYNDARFSNFYQV